MKFEYWVCLVEMIEENYLKFDGFVVLYGSDIMFYIVLVLSFMLENFLKFVIFIGL